MAEAVPLMIQGTSSDAGKSAIAAAFCRIFSQQGFRTAPFKSQNMALNSYITADGKEIGRAQGVQAEAAGIMATTDMNPILIKPTRENVSQIVVHGEPYQNMEAKAYRSEFFSLGLQIIEEAYHRLAQKYERIVIEGAGSPAEVNLNDREMVNMRVARMSNAPVLLVADIERGGVFASLVGTLQLLEPADRERVIGVIINKFRGDKALLQNGLDWFEQYTGKPVLGIVPYIPDLYMDAEDSLILQKYHGLKVCHREIDIAVLQYPRISNFTDIDPFFVEPDCQVRFVSRCEELGEPDCLILPGSKNTIEDLLFLHDHGFGDAIARLHRKGKTFIFGICGGYQMLGERVLDPHQTESPLQRMEGLGFIPMETSMEKKKVTSWSKGFAFFNGYRHAVEGYEIHMGQSRHMRPFSAFIEKGSGMEGSMDTENGIIGTYFHGIFHNDGFRKHFINFMRNSKGLEPIEIRPSFLELREQGFDLLAEQVKRNVKLGRIEYLMKNYQQSKKEGTPL